MKNIRVASAFILMITLSSFSLLACQSVTTTVEDVLTSLADLPMFSLPGGSYQGEQSLVLSSIRGTVHYTLDGSVPNADSPTYSVPILLTSDVTVRAIAIESGYGNSPVAGQTYLINLVESGDTLRGIQVLAGIPTVFFAMDATWVDLHYIINQNFQQNLRMTYNSETDNYEITLPEMADGDSIIYGFTYMYGNTVTDSDWIVYTRGPLVTSESVVTISEATTNGIITATIGVEYAFAVQWVDVHYIVNFGEQQNLRIVYNNSNGHYEIVIPTLHAGDNIVYSFTYAKTSGAVNSIWFKTIVGS